MQPLQYIGLALGGLSVFLYGLLAFSDYLKELAGIRLSTIITRFSGITW